jgi:hypothetical protein
MPRKKPKHEITLREHLESIARSGGQSKSKRKIASSKRNLRKAWKARRNKKKKTRAQPQ